MKLRKFLKIIKNTEQKNVDMKLNNTLFRYVENYFEKFAFMYKEQKCYILRNNTEKNNFSVITITNQDVIKMCNLSSLGHLVPGT